MLTRDRAATARHHLILVAICALVFFTGLGSMRLMDRDEPRNAGCAAEMLARGDFVTPIFNAELRTHKPVLTYWFIISAYKVFGVNEFAARFWSAILGIGTVLMTYHIGRRLLGPDAGLWAGIVTCSSLWFAIAARIATPDSVLVFFSTMPVLIFVLGAFHPIEKNEHCVESAPRLRDPVRVFPRSPFFAAAFYAPMGFAVLAKGPVGFVLPCAVVGMFLLIARRNAAQDEASRGSETYAARPSAGILAGLLRFFSLFSPPHFFRTAFSMRPVLGAAITLAISLPWYILVHQRTDGEWTRGFFLVHNVGRATSAMEGHGGEGLLYLAYLLYYPVVTIVAFMPWSVFLFESFADGSRRLRQRDGMRHGILLAFCWIGVYIGVYTIAGTKLPSYVTPMYPALGLLVGGWISQRIREAPVSRPWALRIIYTLWMAAGFIAVAVIPFALRHSLPGAHWLSALGAIPIAGGIACLALLAKGRRGASLVCFAASGVVLTTAVLGVALPRIDREYQKSHELLASITSRSVNPRVISYRVLEPTWVFYLNRPIKEHYHERPGDREAVVAAMQNPDTFLITTIDDYRRLEPDLPPHVGVVGRIPRYTRPDRPDIVAVGKGGERSR